MTRESIRARPAARPLEHVELSGNGGYTLGPSCRRLQNMYGGYITCIAVTQPILRKRVAAQRRKIVAARRVAE